MTGIVAATVGVGLAGTAASLYSQSKQQEAAGRAAGIAGANAQMQGDMQREMLRQQRELQTATQTDAYGNKIIYDPLQGWIPLLSERGQQMLAANTAAQEAETRKYFGRGQYEDDRAAGRRFEAGGEAERLMRELRNRYGAPTKEGVSGANAVAGVTAATEPADLIKSGAAAAQLRTGGNASGLARGSEALDRSTAQGVRTALARNDATSSPAFEEAFNNWRNNRLSAYKAYSGEAAPPGTVVPTSGTEALSAQLGARAARPMQINPYQGAAQNQATAELLKAMGAQKEMDWGAGITAAGKLGLEAYEKYYPQQKPVVGQGGSIIKTGSTPF